MSSPTGSASKAGAPSAATNPTVGLKAEVELSSPRISTGPAETPAVRISRPQRLSPTTICGSVAHWPMVATASTREPAISTSRSTTPTSPEKQMLGHPWSSLPRSITVQDTRAIDTSLALAAASQAASRHTPREVLHGVLRALMLRHVEEGVCPTIVIRNNRLLLQRANATSVSRPSLSTTAPYHERPSRKSSSDPASDQLHVGDHAAAAELGDTTRSCPYPIIYVNPAARRLLDDTNVQELVGCDFENIFRCFVASPADLEQSLTSMPDALSSTTRPVAFLQVPPPAAEGTPGSLHEVRHASVLFAKGTEDYLTVYCVLNGAYYEAYVTSTDALHLSPSSGVQPLSMAAREKAAACGGRAAASISGYDSTSGVYPQSAGGGELYLVLILLHAVSPAGELESFLSNHAPDASDTLPPKGIPKSHSQRFCSPLAAPTNAHFMSRSVTNISDMAQLRASRGGDQVHLQRRITGGPEKASPKSKRSPGTTPLSSMNAYPPRVPLARDVDGGRGGIPRSTASLGEQRDHASAPVSSSSAMTTGQPFSSLSSQRRAATFSSSSARATPSIAQRSASGVSSPTLRTEGTRSRSMRYSGSNLHDVGPARPQQVGSNDSRATMVLEQSGSSHLHNAGLGQRTVSFTPSGSFAPGGGVPLGNTTQLTQHRAHNIDQVDLTKLRHKLAALPSVSAVLVSASTPNGLFLNSVALLLFVQEVRKHQRDQSLGPVVCFVNIMSTLLVVDVIPLALLGAATPQERLHELEQVYRQVERQQQNPVSKLPVLLQAPFSTGKATAAKQLRIIEEATHTSSATSSLTQPTAISPNTGHSAFGTGLPTLHSSYPSLLIPTSAEPANSSRRTSADDTEVSAAAVPGKKSRETSAATDGLQSTSAPASLAPPTAATTTTPTGSCERSTVLMEPWITADMRDYLTACEATVEYSPEGWATLSIPYITKERLQLLESVDTVQLSTLKGIALFGVSRANALTEEAAQAAHAPPPAIIPLQYDRAADDYRSAATQKSCVVPPLQVRSPKRRSPSARLDVSLSITGASPTTAAEAAHESLPVVPAGHRHVTPVRARPVTANTVAVPTLEVRQESPSGNKKSGSSLSDPRSPPGKIKRERHHDYKQQQHQDQPNGASKADADTPLPQSTAGSPKKIFGFASLVDLTADSNTKESASSFWNGECLPYFNSDADAVSSSATLALPVVLSEHQLEQYPMSRAAKDRPGLDSAAGGESLQQAGQSNAPLCSRVTSLFGGYKFSSSATAALEAISNAVGSPQSIPRARHSALPSSAQRSPAHSGGSSEPPRLKQQPMTTPAKPATATAPAMCRGNDSFAGSCMETNATADSFNNWRNSTRAAGTSPAETDRPLHAVYKRHLHILVYAELPQTEMENRLGGAGHCGTIVTNPAQMLRYLETGVAAFDAIVVDWTKRLITPAVRTTLFSDACNDTAVLYHVAADCAIPFPQTIVPEEAVFTSTDLALSLDVYLQREPIKSFIRKKQLRRDMVELRAEHPYQIVRQIGSGAFGDVFEVFMYTSKGRLAVKRVFLNSVSIRQLEQLNREVLIMRTLDHPNIVTFSHTQLVADAFSIFMELCDGTLRERLNAPTPVALWKRRLSGSHAGISIPTVQSAINSVSNPSTLSMRSPDAFLPGRDSLKHVGRRISPREAILIIHDVASGIAYLHSKGIIHRDIKPGNVLFVDGVAKLGDFGSAVQENEQRPLTNMKGTLGYMSPEVLLGERYGKPCDLWSLGCLLADIIGLHLGHLNGLHVPALIELYRCISYNESLPITISNLRDVSCVNHYSPAMTARILGAIRAASVTASRERSSSIARGHNESSRGTGRYPNAAGAAAAPPPQPPAQQHPADRKDHCGSVILDAANDVSGTDTSAAALDLPSMLEIKSVPARKHLPRSSHPCNGASGGEPAGSTSASAEGQQSRAVTCINTVSDGPCESITSALPSSLVELFERLFRRDPASRMTIEEVLDHPVSWDVEWMTAMMQAVDEITSDFNEHGTASAEKDCLVASTFSIASGATSAVS